MSDIWTKRHKLDMGRLDRQKQLMDEYDKTVYYPAIQALQEECLAIHGSHDKTKYHDNGWGWEWWYCGRCGASHGKNQYNQ